jgi:hypothetical protein
MLSKQLNPEINYLLNTHHALNYLFSTEQELCLLCLVKLREAHAKKLSFSTRFPFLLTAEGLFDVQDGGDAARVPCRLYTDELTTTRSKLVRHFNASPASFADERER